MCINSQIIKHLTNAFLPFLRVKPEKKSSHRDLHFFVPIQRNHKTKPTQPNQECQIKIRWKRRWRCHDKVYTLKKKNDFVENILEYGVVNCGAPFQFALMTLFSSLKYAK